MQYLNIARTPLQLVLKCMQILQHEFPALSHVHNHIIICRPVVYGLKYGLKYDMTGSYLSAATPMLLALHSPDGFVLTTEDEIAF